MEEREEEKRGREKGFCSALYEREKQGGERGRREERWRRRRE